jgi:hypothetical protein
MPEREAVDFNPSQHTGGGTLPRSFFQSDAEYQQYLAQLQRSQQQIQQILEPFGQAAQQRGYNTYEEYDNWRDDDNRNWMIQKGLLPTLGFIGGSAAMGAMGGGGSAAASASGAGAGGGGAMAPIAGGSPWAVTPYAGSATMAGTGAGAAAGAAGAGGGIASLLSGMSARDLAALGLTAAGTVGGLMQDKPNFGPNTQTSDPQLAALMQSMQRRFDKSEPLYDSVLNMANGLLPTQYQKGGGGMG